MPTFELKKAGNAPKIDFSSPLRWDNGAHKNERAHWLGRMTEWLFDFGGEGHTVLNALDVKEAVPAKFEFTFEKPHWAVVAAKVLLLATGIIPLLFVIGKAIYRALNDVVELNEPNDKITKFFLD